MTPEPNDSATAAAIFEPLRPSLTRIAYRMLGSVADAEDIVQEAYLRWVNVDQSTVREPAAFLRRVVSRLCLDQLKSARHQRETYLGPWLPDPVFAPDQNQDDFTLPLMLALERLSPLERAAFLLHDVFGLGFDEIATTLDRDSAACRQLATRARAHIRADRPRFDVPREHGRQIAAAFFEASRSGDLAALRNLLADDVTLYADGGGRVVAASKPISGIETVLNFQAMLVRVFAKSASRLIRYGFINGLPGFVTMEQNEILQTTAFDTDESGHITAIYVTRNPDKVRHLTPLVQ